MARKLVKAWDPHPARTAITTDPKEAEKSAAVLVDPVRFVYLQDHGFLEAEKPPPPAEKPPAPAAAPAVAAEDAAVAAADTHPTPPAPTGEAAAPAGKE